MSRTYVLDTNVLISDPSAIFKFAEHTVVIPLIVLEELDRFKSEQSERGRAARIVGRTLDKYRKSGNLFDGIPINIPIDGGEAGKLVVRITSQEEIDSLPPALDKHKADNIILAAVSSMSSNVQFREVDDVILVTQDVGLRVRCDALDITAEAYRGSKATTNGLYKGWKVLDVTDDDIDKFYINKELTAKEEHFPNEYVLIQGAQKSAIARYSQYDKCYFPLNRNNGLNGNPRIWNIEPRNAQQRFAMDALLDPDIQLVTLCGTAGTGKTLLALACGLYMSADEGVYSRVLAARPVFPMGKDLGFLPGELKDKLAPWMQPIYDNAEHLLNMVDEDGKKKRGHQELIDMGILEIEALTYVRGRSIPQQFMVIDEAQNLTLHEVKTIITRAGEGTKIILTGDPDQIDNPHIDAANCGLAYVVEKFKDRKIAAHVTLEKGERSELATLAAEIL
jgi:PhoH-like ATPase